MPGELVRLSEDEIVILISNLPESKDELILGHMRLAKYLVKKISRRWHNANRNDLLGAAILALVDYVNRLATGEKLMVDGNISRLLARVMINAMQTELCNSTLIRIPARTLFRRVSQNQTARINCRELLDNQYTINTDIEEIDQLEEVRSILKNDLEHEVFDLRYQGLSDTEIGDVLGMNPRSVFRIREDIGKRYLESTDE